MELSLSLLQPNLTRPDASRSLHWPRTDTPDLTILNGRGQRYEGGADTADLSLKWVPEGVAEYRAEGRTVVVSPTRQLMLNRGQPYRLRMRGESETFIVFFAKPLADAAWQAHTGAAETLPEIPLAGASATPGAAQRLRDLRGEARCESPDGERLRELSLGVLADMMSAAAHRRAQLQKIPAMRRGTREELLRRLVQAEDYLIATGRRATLAGAARAAAVSPFHLIRMFDAVYGETPLAYATGKRLESARDNLRRSNVSIAEIAEGAGYESRTAFDRAFVKRFGKTPAAERLS